MRALQNASLARLEVLDRAVKHLAAGVENAHVLVRREHVRVAGPGERDPALAVLARLGVHFAHQEGCARIRIMLRLTKTGLRQLQMRMLVIVVADWVEVRFVADALSPQLLRVLVQAL